MKQLAEPTNHCFNGDNDKGTALRNYYDYIAARGN